MIVQGTNIPIKLVFDTIPLDISVALVNEIAVLKHWDLEDLTVSEDGLEYTAPISQEESFYWEEGPCWIEVEWVDSDGDLAGQKQHLKARESIIYRKDNTILTTEA